jgi:hypothetical protein
MMIQFVAERPRDFFMDWTFSRQVRRTRRAAPRRAGIHHPLLSHW